ncbi:MAG: PQQ-dependent sugar dehydrogenase [Chloroflexota bacterium]
MRLLAIVSLLTLISVTSAGAHPPAASAPSCGDRPGFLTQPWFEVGLVCLQEAFNDPSLGELAFTALASAPDGILYAARPLTGEIIALTDVNGDGVFDSTKVVAAGLTLPNGLDYVDGALYISGGSHIYRLRDGTLDTLVDDLSSGGGFWTGGIAVDPEGRIDVATGASCDFCVSDDPARGAVLSFAPDGSDRQIVATGLRQPADLAFQNGDLWVLDSARTGLLATPDLDELDKVSPNVNFGFPYCVGLHNTPDMPGFDCTTATAPSVAFPTASTPTGIAAYRGDANPAWEGKLLVVLSGSSNSLELRGYRVVIVDPATGSYTSLMPTRPDNNPNTITSPKAMNYLGSGFFPQRPLDVAVSEQGWIYVSVGGGRILVLRP